MPSLWSFTMSFFSILVNFADLYVKLAEISLPAKERKTFLKMFRSELRKIGTCQMDKDYTFDVCSFYSVNKDIKSHYYDVTIRFASTGNVKVVVEKRT